jgi:hypothetical protein
MCRKHIVNELVVVRTIIVVDDSKGIISKSNNRHVQKIAKVLVQKATKKHLETTEWFGVALANTWKQLNAFV